MRPRVGRLPEFLEGHRQIEVRVGVGLVRGERRLVRLGCLGKASRVVQDVGEVVVRFEEIRRQIRRLLVKRERLGQPPIGVVEVAKIDERRDQAGIGDQRLPVEVGSTRA